MLMLLMCVGNSIYAINTTHIIEVIPRVSFRKVPHVPNYFLGYININRKPIPVVDLSILISGQPSHNRMHTRIVLLKKDDDHIPFIGLVGEKITEIAEINIDNFVTPGIHSKELPFLSGIYNGKVESIQLIDVSKLITFLQIESTA